MFGIFGGAFWQKQLVKIEKRLFDLKIKTIKGCSILLVGFSLLFTR